MLQITFVDITEAAYDHTNRRTGNIIEQYKK